MIDKLGTCPNCGTNWDGGDILENLNKMDIFLNKSNVEMNNIARGLGYSKEKPNKFSRVRVHEIDGVTLFECPKLTCSHIFEAETGTEYNSMYDYNRGNVFRGPLEELEKVLPKPTITDELHYVMGIDPYRNDKPGKDGVSFTVKLDNPIEEAARDYLLENSNEVEKIVDKDLVEEMKKFNFDGEPPFEINTDEKDKSGSWFLAQQKLAEEEFKIQEERLFNITSPIKQEEDATKKQEDAGTKHVLKPKSQLFYGTEFRKRRWGR